ncbi:MAG: hypothetical protein ACLSAF_11550 [Intestinimonas sp.]
MEFMAAPFILAMSFLEQACSKTSIKLVEVLRFLRLALIHFGITSEIFRWFSLVQFGPDLLHIAIGGAKACGGQDCFHEKQNLYWFGSRVGFPE